MESKITLNQAGYYQIGIKGILDPNWTDWFDGFEISLFDNNSVLIGMVEDQSALHGVIGKIRDLGLTLIFIKPFENLSIDIEKIPQIKKEELNSTLQPVIIPSSHSSVKEKNIKPTLRSRVDRKIQANSQFPSPNQRFSVRVQRKNKHPHSTKKHD